MRVAVNQAKRARRASQAWGQDMEMRNIVARMGIMGRVRRLLWAV